MPLPMAEPPGPSDWTAETEERRGARRGAVLDRPPAPPRDPPPPGYADPEPSGAGLPVGPRRDKRPGRRRGAITPRTPLVLARLLPHLLVLTIVVTVVAGGGFWDPARQTGPTTLETGTTPDFSVPLDLRGVTPKPETAPGSGYFTRPALPATAVSLDLRLHETRQGETIADVAARYRLRPATLLWANNMQDPAKPLPAGTKLRVPPIDSMLHQVQGNDTLETIAAKYGVEVSAITGYEPNNVQGPGDLVPNQLLLVPGGQMPRRETIELYTVRPGDTLWSIADRFGLNASTVVWANKLTNADLLAVGQTLVIPPVNGVIHRVAPARGPARAAAAAAAGPAGCRRG